MAAPGHSFSRSPSQPKRRESSSYVSDNHINEGNTEADIARSLNQLSLSTSSAARSPATSPKPQWPTLHRTSSTTSLRRSASKSSLNGVSNINGHEARSSTPSLNRKSSLQSLHSSSGFAPTRRASSATILSPSTPKLPELPEQPPVTAASIAHDHFKRDLEVNHSAASGLPTETAVILHDSCYGHRYSRPRTSKAALSTIVERPERIKASVHGVSLAYVRLGDRHSEGRHPVHPKVDPGSLPSVPFRIIKTPRKLAIGSQTVTNVHGTKWMEELKLMCDSAEAKLAMNGKELQRPEMHRGPDQEQPPRKFHEGDLYLCAESRDAFEGALGAVCEAVDTVFGPSATKRAFVAVRPPGHHCSASYPSGFCWLNNVQVGLMHGILNHGITHAAIIDFDLHHGDGSQAIAWEHNSRGVGLAKNAAWWKKTSIGYFSLHDINSYPCEMGDEEKIRNASICIDNAHGQNIWNVHLYAWKTEAEFWEHYETKYSLLLEKARNFLKTQTERLQASNQPSKAAIFISAGFDASEWEGSSMQRHNVNVPTEFYARFTRDIIRIATEEGTSVEGRVISVLEGGYSDRALCSGVLSHLSGLAGEDPVTQEEDYNGLGYEMGSRIGALNDGRREPSTAKSASSSSRPYEPGWWSRFDLEKYEAAIAPPPPPGEPKKPRIVSTGNYTTPTASSQAKVNTPRLRKSTSAMSLKGPPATPSRPPSPPPPEVHWTVAAHELSKLLIPSDRQTRSCQPEDLSAEATRARRDRQSALTGSQPPRPAAQSQGPPIPTRMSLRERKPVKPVGAIREEDDLDTHRRRTVAGSTVLPAEKATPRKPGRPPKPPSRRSSVASTVVCDPAVSVTSNTSSRPATSQGMQPPPPRLDGKPATGSYAGKVRPTASTKKATQSGPSGTSRSSKPGTPASESSDGMEKLTSGMRKIKINVITKAQREARERERAERDKSATGTPSIQSSAPGTPATIPEETVYAPSSGTERSFSAMSYDGTTDLPPAFLPPFTGTGSSMMKQENHQHYMPSGMSSGPQTPYLEQGPALSSQQFPLPASSPVPPSTPAPPQVQVSTPDMFIPYQPEGPTPPAAAPATGGKQEPLRWLPPNVSATPTPMKRGELPIFTSTSAIPFAPGGFSSGGRATAAADQMSVRPPPAFKAEAPNAVKSEAQQHDNSLWDIPKAPQ